MKQVGKKEVVKLIKDFKIKPLFGKVIITLNRVAEDGDLVLSDNVLSEIQYVLAKGSMVTSDIQVGDKVIIDIEKLMVNVNVNSVDAYEQHKQIKVDLIEVDGEAYAIIEDRYIKAVDLR